jgi:hypothetical protein
MTWQLPRHTRCATVTAWVMPLSIAAALSQRHCCYGCCCCAWCTAAGHCSVSVGLVVTAAGVAHRDCMRVGCEGDCPAGHFWCPPVVCSNVKGQVSILMVASCVVVAVYLQGGRSLAFIGVCRKLHTIWQLLAHASGVVCRAGQHMAACGLLLCRMGAHLCCPATRRACNPGCDLQRAVCMQSLYGTVSEGCQRKQLMLCQPVAGVAGLCAQSCC